jgi:hypothetical protein
MENQIPIAVAAVALLFIPCGAQTRKSTSAQVESGSQCANTPYYWQRFTLANAANRVFKLDVLTGDAWVRTDAPSIAWVRVHLSTPGTQPAACPRFRIIETKHDIGLFSPYDPRISDSPRNTAIPADTAVLTNVWLLDTETGAAWLYFINQGFLGDPLPDETPKH